MIRRVRPLFALIPLACTTITGSSAAGVSAINRELARSAARGPSLTFEKNEGQFDNAVEFVARGQGYSLFLTRQDGVLVLRRPDTDQKGPGLKVKPSSRAVAKSLVVRLRLTGIASDSIVLGTDQRRGFVNYYQGRDPDRHLTNVPTFGRVEYLGIYPGVDMVYYGSENGSLQYDFRIAPGGDYRDIALRFEGELQRESGIQTDARGNLVLTMQDGAQVAWKKPFAYQMIDGLQQEVAAQFEVCSDRSVGFALGEFDRTKPLVIDPVFNYTSYLGGAGSDEATGIAVDGGGNAWVVGSTGSTNFPVAGPPFQGNNGNNNNSPDVFISKFSPAGALLYSTYFGGSAGDLGAGITIDGQGNAWVTGRALSTNLPITGSAIQATNAGGGDAFVAKFGPTGNLLYSSYLGGSGDDEASAIDVDGSNNIWICGITNSGNFRTAGNPAFGANSGGMDAFAAKFNSGGQLVYSTYLGGAGNDFGYGIAVDSSGNAWATGNTGSTNFPTSGTPAQPSSGGLSDAFLAKFAATGSLVYSTYLGGVNNENGFAIAIDPQNNAWIAGDTGSSNFPTTSGSYQTSYTAFQEGIVARFSPTGALLYSTFLGASGFEAVYGIAVAPGGDVWLAGFTSSSEDYSLTPNPFQSSYGGGIQDAFVTKLTSAGALSYSTYLGGASVEAANAIAVGPNNQVWFAGYSVSSNLPMVGAPFQSAGGGNSVDAFVGRLDSNTSPAVEQRLVNISTRMRVETGDNALIGGFIVQGTRSKRMILRALGPSLTASGIPALETLQDPTLTLYDSTGAILISNDDWKNGAQRQAVIDSTIPPTDDRESAVVAALNPGAYTAVLRGSGGGTGVALVELYDLDAASPSSAVNISTRGRVETGANVMIGGFILGGTTPATVIIRAIGPSLSASVTGALQDPTLELRDGNGSLVDSNDNWVDSPQRQAIIDTTIPPTDNRESAVLRTLNPGSYTAIVRGVNATQGVALVEVYKLN